MSAPDFDSLSVEAASVLRQPSAWDRVRQSGSVRLGGVVLLLLVLIALAAPWLGTVDPSLFDPASRDLLPGKTGEITTLEGETLKHRFLMGSDSFGRDIYSRVIYGTQVSLIVGLFTAIVAMALGILFGLLAGFLRWPRGPPRARPCRRSWSTHWSMPTRRPSCRSLHSKAPTLPPPACWSRPRAMPHAMCMWRCCASRRAAPLSTVATPVRAIPGAITMMTRTGSGSPKSSNAR